MYTFKLVFYKSMTLSAFLSKQTQQNRRYFKHRSQPAGRFCKSLDGAYIEGILAEEVIRIIGLDNGEELGLPKYFKRKAKYLKERSLEALDIAHQEGAKIGSGSDLIGSIQGLKEQILELKSRVLGPMGAIIATTRTNAELVRQ